jgi:hypothetical protein
MNAIVVLLMTASTTAADPMPVVQGTTTPVPVYSYSEPMSSGTTDNGRPRLFGRIRKLFRRGSQPSEQMPVTTYTTTPSGSTVSNVWGGSMAPPLAGSPAATSSGTTTATPVLRPVPTSTSPDSGSAKRMPAGSPF